MTLAYGAHGAADVPDPMSGAITGPGTQSRSSLRRYVQDKRSDVSRRPLERRTSREAVTPTAPRSTRSPTQRKVVGQHTSDQTLAETDTINLDIRKILDTTTAEWGVEVTLVELKDIQLPDSMKRAMARQAEAEREKRAKIINAEDESLAAAALGEASDTMMAHPLALQLRNLQSLVEIGVDKNTGGGRTVTGTLPAVAHHSPGRICGHPNPPRPRSRPCRETPSRAEGPRFC